MGRVAPWVNGRGSRTVTVVVFVRPAVFDGGRCQADPPGPQPMFDRGMFDLPVAGRRLPFAFMPPYLNTLNFSEQELESRLGWRLTRDAIAEMNAVSRSFGAEFAVMFVPFKSQVYLPLLERTFSPEALRSSFSFYLEAYGRDVDVRRLSANRLAQNHMMRRFCEQAGIPFVDSTPALERRRPVRRERRTSPTSPT